MKNLNYNNNGNVEIIKEEKWKSKERKFFLIVKKIKVQNDSEVQYTLEILIESGPLLQLIYPNEPFSFELSKNSINFCGHTFEITDDSEIKLDGKIVKFPLVGSRFCAFVNNEAVLVL